MSPRLPNEFSLSLWSLPCASSLFQRCLVDGLRHSTKEKVPSRPRRVSEQFFWSPHSGGFFLEVGDPSLNLPSPSRPCICSMVDERDWRLKDCTFKHGCGIPTQQPPSWHWALCTLIYVLLFYSVAKQFLVGCKEPATEIQDLCHRLRIPDSARQAFLDHVMHLDLLSKATGSSTITDSIAATLKSTWFAIENGQQIQAPTTGSRPGDPLADVLYGFVMSEFLSVVHARLEDADVWRFTPGQDFAQPVNLTWVDDTAFAIYAPSDSITSLTLEALACIIDTATEFGLSLSYGPGKTAGVTSFHGRGSIKARQTFEPKFPYELPVITEHQGLAPVPLTNHYRHLGGVVPRGGTLLPELKIRAALTQSRIKPLRRVLADQRIELRHRQNVLRSIGLSVASLHSATWFAMNTSDFKAWQALIFRLYSALQPLGTEEFPPLFELASQANAAMPMELLHISKIRLLIHMVQVGDDLMFEAILRNHHLAGHGSWLASLMRSCEWWKEQIGLEAWNVNLDRLTDLQAWRDLQPSARDLKRSLKHAQLAHQSRLRTWVVLYHHMEFQRQAFLDLGWTLYEAPSESPDQAVTCQECSCRFATHAALAVHQSRKHGQRMLIRRFAADSVRRPCGRQFRTRTRVMSHLHCGSTRCWLATLRAFEPLTVEEATCLDDADKANNLAY